MFNTLLDIDYIVASLVILIALYIFSKRKYSTVTKANRIFYHMVLVAIVTCIGNILMNYSATYTDVFSTWGYMLFRMWFNIGTVFITFLGYRYARMYQGEKRTYFLMVSDILAILLFAVHAILAIVNIFTGIIAYVDESGIKHGPLFSINTIIPMLLFALVLATMLSNREDYTKAQRYSILVYFLITFLFVIVELLTSNRAPLTMFGVAISLIVIQQSLVSPEFLKLEKSLTEAEDARLAAEEANKAKSSFLARMSHEIRTPLNAVIGFNAIITRESKDENIKNYAMDAKTAGENLLGLINEILDMSKIESGKLEIIEDEYSFKKLLREEYMMFSLKAEEKGLKLTFDIDPDIPSVLYGDELRIKQVLTNIVSNAIKYTPTGSVKLKAMLEKKEADEAFIRYEVIDSGMGIKEEDLGKLFDAFERIEEKKNRKIEGTGLGVNICASLLTMMGSKLNVDSVYGEGSTFSFVLKQRIVDEKPVGAFDNSKINTDDEKELKLIDAPNSRILVVDDTTLNLKVFVGLLKDTRIKVDVADSGKKALNMTKAIKYDLIFMDHLMPEMDGIETMGCIRNQENGKNKETNIVALTANSLKGAYEEYLSYGFTDALFKPVKLAELNDILIRYIKVN